MATQTITVMFTDLIGSTELISRSGMPWPTSCGENTSHCCVR
jgi:hypothetical protein